MYNYLIEKHKINKYAGFTVIALNDLSYKIHI